MRAEKIPTGIEGLDRMLKGGLVPGRNVLLSGPAGSGKSTIAMQYAYNGALYGEPSLYVTLEETKEKLINDMGKFGFDLKKAEAMGGLHIVGGPMAKVTNFMKKVDADVLNLVGEIEEIVKERGIKRVVIDSVNLLTMLMKNEREKREALAALANMLSSLGCTAIFTSETEEGKMSLSRYGIEEFVVDGVIVLYLVRQGSRFVPGIVVRKMRGSNHDKEIRVYKITDRGAVVYPAETMFGKI